MTGVTTGRIAPQGAAVPQGARKHRRTGAWMAAAGAVALLAAQASASTWNYNGSDNWSTASRWTGGVPNSEGAVADFSTLNINSDRTVTLDINASVGGLLFGDNTNVNKDWFLTTTTGKVLTLNAASGAPYIDVKNRTATLSVVMQGSEGMEKRGAGILILNAASTYTGPTVISQGTLTLSASGSIAGTSAIQVADGAAYDTSAITSYTLTTGQALKGNGRVRGRVGVDGGKVAPGSSAGVLTFEGGLGLASGSLLEFDLGDPATSGASDRIDVSGGSLTLDGTLNVTTLSGYTPVGGETWRLMNYPIGTLTNSILAIGTMPALAPGLSWEIDTSTAGAVDLRVMPEPATLALLGLGAAALAIRRRRS